MNILPLPQNLFAQQVLSNYSSWWQNYESEFSVKIPLGQSQHYMLQRKYADDSRLKFKKGDCPRKAIPCIEISPLYREAKDGILFVNCNPSGTDYEYYRDHNTNHEDCFYYGEQKPNNSYFNAAEAFATAVGINNDNFAMIDVFPIVIQNQAVLKEAYNKATGRQREAFDELLRYFLNNIVRIHPKVIVATNAFVKDLLTDNDVKRPYSLRQLGRFDDFHPDGDRVCYHITIKDLETTLFCGGMIAGGHQMDTESKSRLIRDVKYFRNHSSIHF